MFRFTSPPPPLPPRRPMNRVASREILIEKIGKITHRKTIINRYISKNKTNHFFIIKLETVTIDEPRRPPPCMVSYVRTPSPTIRQVKIRPRPSSCFDLHRASTGLTLNI